MDWGNPSSSDRLTIDLSEHLAKYAVNYCSVSDTEDHLIMMDDNHVACKGVSTKYFQAGKFLSCGCVTYAVAQNKPFWVSSFSAMQMFIGGAQTMGPGAPGGVVTRPLSFFCTW